MNYGTAEGEIVDRLNSYFAANNVADSFEASLMPETEEQFRTFYNNYSKTRVAVQFFDSTPQSSSAIGCTTQDEFVRFRLSFEARKLRGDGGLYQMMELVKKSLIGFAPSNAGKLEYKKYGLLEFEQNSWQPYFEFECKTVNVQAFSDFSDDDPLSANNGITVTSIDA